MTHLSLPSNLKTYKIKLASNSPRRKELLQLLGLSFEVVNNKEVEEVCPETIPVINRPEYLAILKASAYYPDLTDSDLLITADTMVILDDKALGKPRDYEDAVNMLRELSDRTHEVVTGVVVCSRKLQISFSVTTKVEFGKLSDTEIKSYVEACKPFDKAGAYGIQEWIGAIGIKGIQGSYYNVMGLPVHYLYSVLQQF